MNRIDQRQRCDAVDGLGHPFQEMGGLGDLASRVDGRVGRSLTGDGLRRNAAGRVRRRLRGETGLDLL